MSSGGAAEVIDLSSDGDDDEESLPFPSTSTITIAPPLTCDVKPYEVADVKPLLYPIQPPGCYALVPIKDEEPVPLPLAAEASEPPRALPPPRLCRQFWKSGEYVVARRNPDADAPGMLTAEILARRLFAFAIFSTLLPFDFCVCDLVVCRWTESAEDQSKVPALKCYFPQVGIWRYENLLILEKTPCS